MSLPRIKFLAIARMSDSKILCCHGTERKNEDSYRAESRVILDKLQDVYLKAGERQKIRTANGAWFNTCDAKDIFYLLLADASYPEKCAYSMTAEVVEELRNLNNYNNESQAVIQNHSRNYVPDLIEKYNDLEKVDALSATQSGLDHIKDVMGDTISKALENKETFDELDRKADDLNVTAQGFHSASQDLANKMRQRNRKLMIYGSIGIVLFILLYFVIKH